MIDQYSRDLQANDLKSVDVPRLIDTARQKAKKCGYAIGVHGSLKRDIDLIAVPWIDEAEEPGVLVDAISDSIGGFVVKDPTKNPTQKPHGRLAWVIHLPGKHTYVDLSVMPRIIPEACHACHYEDCICQR